VSFLFSLRNNSSLCPLSWHVFVSRLQEVSSGATKVQGSISGNAQSCVQSDLEEVYEGSKVTWMCIGDYFADGRLLG